jgi:hypothetical protein
MPLSRLAAEYNRFSTRGTFWHGVMFFAAGILLFTFLHLYGVPLTHAAPAQVITAVGIIWMIWTFRRIEYVQFVSHDGLPLLYVVGYGPDASRFQEFVDKLAGQIQQSKV